MKSIRKKLIKNFYLYVLMSVCNVALAFDPPKLSDYQRKDLAKAGIVKVIYNCEIRTGPKRKDTLSVRQYNVDGFLEALDSFKVGNDNSHHLFLSRRIIYSKDKNINLLRIEERKRLGDSFFQNLSVQSFDEAEKLIQETFFIDGDTTIFDYKYDQAGNCIKKIGKVLNRKITTNYIYLYEYDKDSNITKEESYYNSKLEYSVLYKYNGSGLMLSSSRNEEITEKYEYDKSGKITLKERGCPANLKYRPHLDEKSPEGGTGHKYSYVYKNNGLLHKIRLHYFECYPSNKITSKYTEKFKYSSNGLLRSKCGLMSCYKYIYLKN